MHSKLLNERETLFEKNELQSQSELTNQTGIPCTGTVRAASESVQGSESFFF